MAGSYTSDMSYLPFWVMRLKGKPENDDFEAIFAAVDELLARGEHWIGLMDLSETGIPKEINNRMLLGLFRERKDEMNRLVLGSITLVKSRFVEVVANSIIAILPTKYPSHVFTDAEEAVDFMLELAAKAELDIPPERRQELMEYLGG